MSTGDDQHLKTTLDVGSGDFQPNPIYGDAPPSYAGRSTYDASPNIKQPQQDDNYQYPNNQQGNQEDNEENNPINDDDNNQQQYDEQYEDDDQQQYDNQQYDNNEIQQNAPPPYSEDPPAAPEPYTDQNTTQGDDYDNDPEDVVAQMKDETDDDDVDYGITQPKGDDNELSDGENGVGLFGNYFIRTVYMAGSILFCSMLAFALWFREPLGTDFDAGWGISGFAAFMLFLGSLLAIAFAIVKKLGRPIPGEKFVLWAIIGIYVIGGLFYFLGGCAVAYGFNTVNLGYFGGFFFAEQTFVGIHGIVAGMDLWNRKILNNKKLRVIIYNAAFLLLSIIAFFAYAITSTKFDEMGADNAAPAFLALFYFIVLIPEIIYLVIYLVPKLNELLGKPIVLLIIAASYLLSVVCILIGYFIIVGDFQGLQGRAYFLGVGFFVLLTGIIIAFDMLFDRFIPGYKDGGQSVSDQAVKGDSAAIATEDIDNDFDDAVDNDVYDD